MATAPLGQPHESLRSILLAPNGVGFKGTVAATEKQSIPCHNAYPHPHGSRLRVRLLARHQKTPVATVCPGAYLATRYTVTPDPRFPIPKTLGLSTCRKR